jgi:predicted amidophosphoribosyltransferase
MFFVRVCPLCRRPGAAPCDDCWQAIEPAIPGPVAALLSFQGEGARLLKGLKYGNGRSVVQRLADGMSLLVEPCWADVVTWAPTSAHRRRERGYDQAELLAKAVARRLGVPSRSLLRRLPGDGPQTGRSRADRLVGPTFVAKRLAPARVLLIDDVVTTGSTLRSAEAVLRTSGARDVRLLAAASTPDSHSQPGPVGRDSAHSLWHRSPPDRFPAAAEAVWPHYG